MVATEIGAERADAATTPTKPHESSRDDGYNQHRHTITTRNDTRNTPERLRRDERTGPHIPLGERHCACEQNRTQNEARDSKIGHDTNEIELHGHIAAVHEPEYDSVQHTVNGTKTDKAFT